VSTVLSRSRAVRGHGHRAPVLTGFALVCAALMAWSLRDRAQFLPSGSPATPVPVTGSHGHAGGGATAPAPVTGELFANYPGLVFLGLHIMLPAALLVAYVAVRLCRGTGRDRESVMARLVFAAGFAAAAALATPLVASLSLGTAITFANTLAAAVIVAQYAFALAVVGVIVFGVP
jgi:hypothetical protein